MPPTLDNILPAQSKEALRNLELMARKTVDGLLHGPHGSKRLGVSVDFDHHTLYQPGDAIRHIDWRASAKHDRFYVRRFREDTCLNVQLVLDFSASMLAANGPHTKTSHAISLAACLAYLVVQQGDRIGMLALSEGERIHRPLGSSGLHLVEVLNALISHDAKGKDDTVRHLGALVEQSLSRGLLIFISDMMYEPEPVQRELARLHHQGHEVVVVNVRDSHEEAFPFSQWVNFIDLEQAYKPVKIDTVLLRKLYAEEYQSVMSEWETWSKGQDIHLVTSYSHEGADAALMGYLEYRNRIGRR